MQVERGRFDARPGRKNIRSLLVRLAALLGLKTEMKRKSAIIFASIWLALSAYHVLTWLLVPAQTVTVIERVYRGGTTRGTYLGFSLPGGETRSVAEYWVASPVNPGERIPVQKSPLFDSYHRAHWYSAFRWSLFFGIAALVGWAFVVAPSRKKK